MCPKCPPAIFACSAERRRSRQRGVSLLLLSLVLTVVMAAAGAAIDLVQLHFVRSELQNYADATALRAASQLDGLSTGIVRAQAAAEELRPTSIITLTVRFAEAPGDEGVEESVARGAEEQPPLTPNPYRYVRVLVSAPASLAFSQFLPGVEVASAVQARAVAGSKPVAAAVADSVAVLPLAPIALDDTDTSHWGFVPGQLYTLYTDGRGTACSDVDTSANGARTLLDFGSGAAETPAALRDLLLNGSPAPAAESTEFSLITPQSPESLYQALAGRAAQDIDTAARTYESYTGNGRRLILTPVRSAASPKRIEGYGAFLLPPPNALAGLSSGSVCGVYIGAGNRNGRSTAAIDGKQIYETALVR